MMRLTPSVTPNSTMSEICTLITENRVQQQWQQQQQHCNHQQQHTSSNSKPYGESSSEVHTLLTHFKGHLADNGHVARCCDFWSRHGNRHFKKPPSSAVTTHRHTCVSSALACATTGRGASCRARASGGQTYLCLLWGLLHPVFAVSFHANVYSVCPVPTYAMAYVGFTPRMGMA
jgi:hypothetical protein